MTAAVAAHWLSGLWISPPGLPAVGTGEVDPDFGFRFVFHGEDWIAASSPVQALLSQASAPWSVFTYPDETPPRTIVVGSAAALLAAGTIAAAGGSELAALNALVGG